MCGRAFILSVGIGQAVDAKSGPDAKLGGKTQKQFPASPQIVLKKTWPEANSVSSEWDSSAADLNRVGGAIQAPAGGRINNVDELGARGGRHDL